MGLNIFFLKISSIFSSLNIPSIKKLKRNNIPTHIAVIMDGNGRWATKRNLPRMFGHQKGAEVLREIVIACKDIGVKYLTAFSFSTENWQRPKDEVEGLMSLFVEVLNRELPGLIKNNIKLSLIGDRSTIPKDILDVFLNAEEKTKNNDSLIFNIAFNYGSRYEIYQAAEKMVEEFNENNSLIKEYKTKTIEEKVNLFSNFLYTNGLPDPDLLIRTSGEYRLSNFLLWQLAYTELYFTKVLWPDFSRKHFFKAIYSYQKRNRRFGKV